MESIDLCLFYLLLCSQYVQEYLTHNSKGRICANSFNEAIMVFIDGNHYYAAMHTALHQGNVPVF